MQIKNVWLISRRILEHKKDRNASHCVCWMYVQRYSLFSLKKWLVILQQRICGVEEREAEPHN